MGCETEPIYSKRPASDIPIPKKRRRRAESRSTSCSSSRSGSPVNFTQGRAQKPTLNFAAPKHQDLPKPAPVIALPHQDILKPAPLKPAPAQPLPHSSHDTSIPNSTFIPPKHKDLLLQLKSQLPQQSGTADLPKFDSKALTGGAKRPLKRVHSVENPTSPEHSPPSEVPVISNGTNNYIPTFAPPVTPAPVTRRLDFDFSETVSSISNNSIPSEMFSSPPVLSLESVSVPTSALDSEINCIPDYLGPNSLPERSVKPRVSTESLNDAIGFEILDMPELQLEPEVKVEDCGSVQRKESKEENKVDTAESKSQVSDEFAPLSFDDMFLQEILPPPKPDRVQNLLDSIGMAESDDSKPTTHSVSVSTNSQDVPKVSPARRSRKLSNSTSQNSKPSKKKTKTKKETKIVANGIKSPGMTSAKNGVMDMGTFAESTAPPQTIAAYLKKHLYLSWKNKDALCWLDVAMNLLVHSRMLYMIMNPIPSTSAPVIKQLFENYTKAQSFFKQGLELKRCQLLGQQKRIALETSVGIVNVKTGGGDASDFLSSGTPETHICKANISPLLPKKRQDSQDSLEVTTEQLQGRADQLCSAAEEVLNSCRENVWNYLYPKLKCEKGQHDSPVFALPMLLGEEPGVKKQLMHNFEWCMTCSACGHEHRDR